MVEVRIRETVNDIERIEIERFVSILIHESFLSFSVGVLEFLFDFFLELLELMSAIGGITSCEVFLRICEGIIQLKHEILVANPVALVGLMLEGDEGVEKGGGGGSLL